MNSDNLIIWVDLIIAAIIIIVLVRFATQLHRVTERICEMVERDQVNVERLEATVDRMEAATKVVAKNLASSVSRADATEGEAGEAADAALRTGDSAQAIRERQNDTR